QGQHLVSVRKSTWGRWQAVGGAVQRGFNDVCQPDVLAVSGFESSVPVSDPSGYTRGAGGEATGFRLRRSTRVGLQSSVIASLFPLSKAQSVCEAPTCHTSSKKARRSGSFSALTNRLCSSKVTPRLGL